MTEMSEVEKPQVTRKINRNNIPLEEIFGSLPIVCSGGCYGNIDVGGKSRKIIVRDPFVSYIEKETADERGEKLLGLFRENIHELESSINNKLGAEIVKVEIKSEGYGEARTIRKSRKEYLFKA